ncbi:anthranilate synthase component I family protein [Streptomyces sp. NPDC006487]|uniref:anthranilate synthase component I family protein n=1 Tax=Streptomyces sp. NPDC006487 TaxID=3364748 RepID=UPI00367D1EBC
MPTVNVRIRTTTLPASHAPLDLYTRLGSQLGTDQVFLFEHPVGSEPGRMAALVGWGRLLQLRVYANRVEIDGLASLTVLARAAAAAAGLREDDGGGAWRGPSPSVWELLRATQRLFELEGESPCEGFSFGFVTVIGYGAAGHMERLRADTDPAKADITLTLFRTTAHYAADGEPPVLVHAAADGWPAAPEVDLSPLVGADEPVPAPEVYEVRDSMEREDFLHRVRRCLAHIADGEVNQIQVGHRIDVRSSLSPVDVYRRLRARNPSPHMYLLPHATGTVIGASPELLFRMSGDTLTLRSIAGTAHRSGDPQTDERRVAELVKDPKERAEHLMLVDLAREDLAAVTGPGNPPVEKLMSVEAFSHVFHMISTVSGKLLPDADVWSALCSAFPAGTVTGVPRPRAMELIGTLEIEPRGLYAGAVGLLDVRGWNELALCIRTIVHDGAVYSTQSSAGIVEGSDPAAEWNETMAKMSAAYWALTGKELLA